MFDAHHDILPDLLTIAAGVALGILLILTWSVGHFAGLSLPVGTGSSVISG
jgi:hypothetical protein